MRKFVQYRFKSMAIISTPLCRNNFLFSPQAPFSLSPFFRYPCFKISSVCLRKGKRNSQTARRSMSIWFPAGQGPKQKRQLSSSCLYVYIKARSVSLLCHLCNADLSPQFYSIRSLFLYLDYWNNAPRCRFPHKRSLLCLCEVAQYRSGPLYDPRGKRTSLSEHFLLYLSQCMFFNFFSFCTYN